MPSTVAAGMRYLFESAIISFRYGNHAWSNTQLLDGVSCVSRNCATAMQGQRHGGSTHWLVCGSSSCRWICYQNPAKQWNRYDRPSVNRPWCFVVMAWPSVRQFVNRSSSVLDQGERDSSSVMAVGWAGDGLIEFRQSKHSDSDIGQNPLPRLTTGSAAWSVLWLV